MSPTPQRGKSRWLYISSMLVSSSQTVLNTVGVCAVIRRVHVSARSLENGHRVLLSPKDERDHPDFLQWWVQKQTSVLVLGDKRGFICVQVSLTCRGGIYWDCRRHLMVLRWHLSWKQDDARPHPAHAETEWFIDKIFFTQLFIFCQINLADKCV